MRFLVTNVTPYTMPVFPANYAGGWTGIFAGSAANDYSFTSLVQ